MGRGWGVLAPKSTPRIHPTEAQQQLLADLEVRLLAAGELERWQTLVCAHHYLGDATMVGECLRYVAVSAAGEWVALLGWASASLHLGTVRPGWGGAWSSAAAGCGWSPRTPVF